MLSVNLDKLRKHVKLYHILFVILDVTEWQ